MSLIDSIVSLAKMDDSIEAMWLYGSRAKGNASKESDYDLAVLFRQFEQDPLQLQRRTRPECLALDWVHSLGLPLFR
ncbi:nucleotidyltransferase domain-containing protein [Aliivibrio sifiae]|uniref:nucleotidyltransferase domain-containing protein n=1 Tax=Aliivibrio sifiae TaxID=566293 RepID=UPI002157B367|nr:nucleotidyltransferase domain-containing protein [Aliivibrio sifiae]